MHVSISGAVKDCPATFNWHRVIIAPRGEICNCNTCLQTWARFTCYSTCCKDFHLGGTAGAKFQYSVFFCLVSGLLVVYGM